VTVETASLLPIHWNTIRLSDVKKESQKQGHICSKNSLVVRTLMDLEKDFCYLQIDYATFR